MFAQLDRQVTFIFGSLLKPFLWFPTFSFLCRGRRLDLKHFIVFFVTLVCSLHLSMSDFY